MITMEKAMLLLAAGSSFLTSGALAAGNQENVLVKNAGVTPQTSTDRISYQCTFRNLWTEDRHPVNFPFGQAGWAGPILWTHTLQYAPWPEGDSVTRGIEKLAEDGFTDVLLQEMDQQGEQVHDHSEYPGGGFSVQNTTFVHLPPIEATLECKYLSMAAGMQPSPDWFTGFYSFWLIDEYAQTWYDHFKIQVSPWDAGTDAGTTYESLDNDLNPPQPVQRFRPGMNPSEELSGVDGSYPSVGELECFLVVGDTDIEMPDCDWFANPCCNETDNVNCEALLPNGAAPTLSPSPSTSAGTATTRPGTLISGMPFLLAVMVVASIASH